MAYKTIRRLYGVTARTGLSGSTIYHLMSKGEFPQQIKLGPRAVGWDDDEIEAWIQDRIKESREGDSE